jgi:hypothetical protein
MSFQNLTTEETTPDSCRVTVKPECMVRRFAASEMWAVTTGRLWMNPKNAAGI